MHILHWKFFWPLIVRNTSNQKRETRRTLPVCLQRHHGHGSEQRNLNGGHETGHEGTCDGELQGMVVYSVNFYHTTASESSRLERCSYNCTTSLHQRSKLMRNISFNLPMFHVLTMHNAFGLGT